MPRGISRVTGVAHEEGKTLNKQTFVPCDQGLDMVDLFFVFCFFGGENPTFFLREQNFLLETDRGRTRRLRRGAHC